MSQQWSLPAASGVLQYSTQFNSTNWCLETTGNAGPAYIDMCDDSSGSIHFTQGQDGTIRSGKTCLTEPDGNTQINYAPCVANDSTQQWSSQSDRELLNLDNNLAAIAYLDHTWMLKGVALQPGPTGPSWALVS